MLGELEDGWGREEDRRVNYRDRGIGKKDGRGHDAYCFWQFLPIKSDRGEEPHREAGRDRSFPHGIDSHKCSNRNTTYFLEHEQFCFCRVPSRGTRASCRLISHPSACPHPSEMSPEAGY